MMVRLVPRVFVALGLLCLVAAVPKFRIKTRSEDDICREPLPEISLEINSIHKGLVEDVNVENVIQIAKLVGADSEITQGEVATEPPVLEVEDDVLDAWNRIADEEEAKLVADLEERPKSPPHLKRNIVVSGSNQIGKGGYKVVFKEIYEGVQRAVARIPRSRYDEVKREWAYQEAVRAVLIGGAPVCKNFVPEVIGVLHTSTYVFMVSELAEGDIDTYTSPSKTRSAFQKWEATRAKDDVSQVVALAQMAVGLKCVKAAGLVHRDVKPANFLVASDSTHRLLVNDFGLSVKKCRGVGPEPERSFGLRMCVSSDEPLSMECCTSADVAFITSFDGREYYYWPNGEDLSAMGSELDVYSLGVSFQDMMASSVDTFGLARPTVRMLVEQMTSDTPPSIDDVILDLLRFLKLQKKTKLTASLGRVLELQESMFSYLAKLEEGVTKDTSSWNQEIRERTDYLAEREREAAEELAHWEAVRTELANYEAAPRLIRWCMPKPELGPKPAEYVPDAEMQRQIADLQTKIRKRVKEMDRLKELIKMSMA